MPGSQGIPRFLGFCFILAWPLPALIPHPPAGPRACPGGPLITGLLPLMQSKLVGHPHFHPERGHESSGRHNDANWSGEETLYFAKTVGKLLV